MTYQRPLNKASKTIEWNIKDHWIKYKGQFNDLSKTTNDISKTSKWHSKEHISMHVCVLWNQLSSNTGRTVDKWHFSRCVMEDKQHMTMITWLFRYWPECASTDTGLHADHQFCSLDVLQRHPELWDQNLSWFLSSHIYNIISLTHDTSYTSPQ